MFLSLLTKISISSLDGVEYSSDKKRLISAPSNLFNYIVPKECEIIEGGDSSLKSSFVQCINTIRNITFEENSLLSCIYPYVFKQSSLEYIDLSKCTQLPYLNRSIFYQCFKLSFVKLPEGITEIKAGCFYNDISLKSVTIPNSVVKLEGWTSGHSSVFTKCTSLSEVIISENSRLVIIDADALASTIITHLYIPINLSQLSSGIFDTRLSSFTIHPDNQYFSFDGTCLLSKNQEKLYCLIYNDGITFTVPEYIKSFEYGCCRGNHLKKIIFNHPINYFSQYSFGQTSLESFTFPEGITTISITMFEDCFNLTSVHLPSSLTKILAHGFRSCISLSDINIIDSISEIDYRAFEHCRSLTTFSCPKSLNKLGHSVFCDCPNIQFNLNGNPFLTLDDNNVLYLGSASKAYFGKDGDVLLPSTCDSIDQSTFKFTKLTKITITTTSPLTIANDAFYGTLLEEVTLPSCLKYLGNSAFCNIETLKTVNIDTSSRIISIPAGCFCNCSSLNTISFPSGITAIEDDAFFNCTSLTEFDISNTIIGRIGNRAFANSSLTSVVCPSSLNFIGEEAYKNSQLQTVDMRQAGLTSIEEGAFSLCSSMHSVLFNDKAKTINSFAFSRCAELTQLEFPLEIEFIKPRAFEFCIKLQRFDLKLNCNLDTIEGLAFYGCPELKEIGVKPEDEKFVAEDGVLYDKDKTVLKIFLPASKVTIFVIPATVQRIGSYAFHSCRNIRTLAIPEGSINSVGYHCFEGCTSLSSLYFPRTLTEFGQDAFINCPRLGCGSVSYINGNQEKAIKAGIPKIAFETDCPTISFHTCKETHRFVPSSFLSFAVLIFSLK